MITELRLQNWKSFADAKVFIDPLTIVIGTNASGKSNIFDALKFLRALSTPRYVTEVLNELRGGVSGAIRRGETFCKLSIVVSDEVEDGTEWCYEVGLSYDEKQNVYISAEKLSEQGTDTAESVVLFERVALAEPLSSEVLVSYYAPEHHYKWFFQSGASVLSQLAYIDCHERIKKAASSVAVHLKRIRLANPIPEHMRGYSTLSDVLWEDASNLAGYLANMDEESQQLVYSELLKYLAPLPDKDIKDIRAEKIPLTNDAMLVCAEEWIPGEWQEQSARGMSDGTLRFAGIIAMLVTAEDKSLILLEELDKGVHPSRAKAMVKMLREIGHEKQLDIVCTTHNATFVDELGAQMIPFISYVKRSEENGCTDVCLLDEKDNLTRLMATRSVGAMMTHNEL